MVVLGLLIKATISDHTFIVIPEVHIFIWCSLFSLYLPIPYVPICQRSIHSSWLLLWSPYPWIGDASFSAKPPSAFSAVFCCSPDHFAFMTLFSALLWIVSCFRWQFLSLFLIFSHSFKRIFISSHVLTFLPAQCPPHGRSWQSLLYDTINSPAPPSHHKNLHWVHSPPLWFACTLVDMTQQACTAILMNSGSLTSS